MCRHTTVNTVNLQGISTPQIPLSQEIQVNQDSKTINSLGCSLETISESTDSESLIPFCPIDEENNYFYSLTEEEGLMDLYDMYDLKPSFPLDC